MAFRTRCPSCGTLFSAPDDMLGREIKCPRCKSFFMAAKEHPAQASPEARGPGVGGPLPSERRAPGYAPPGAPGAPGAMSPESKPEFFCKACNTGFTQDDILDGLAVKRFDEVYCRKHFRMNFPDECEQHPGTKAVAQCARCGMPLCQNCVIELQNEKLCSRCKRRVLGELRGDYAAGAPYDYGARQGLPWEQAGGSFLGSMFQTVGAVLFSPSLAFQRMHIRGGYGKPLFFAWLLSCAGTFLAYAWQFMIMGAAGGFGPMYQDTGPMPIGALLVVYLIFAAFAALIGPFISAAIFHVCLMIVKGAKQDYECTYRVVAYAAGATAVFNVIPIAGMYIGGIWAIVVTIIGFSRAHGITGGRAALAYFLPIIVCCGGGIILAVLAVAMSSGIPR